jgi:hypothetical protein
MARAHEEALSELHALLTNKFKELLLSGECNGAVLNTVRQFLKDNGITCDLSEDPVGQELIASLPIFEEDLVIDKDGKIKEG